MVSTEGTEREVVVERDEDLEKKGRVDRRQFKRQRKSRTMTVSVYNRETLKRF